MLPQVLIAFISYSPHTCIFMACIWVDVHEFPFVFPTDYKRRAKVLGHYFLFCFRFLQLSMNVKGKSQEV